VLIVRTLVDPNDPNDVNAVHALQDAIKDSARGALDPNHLDQTMDVTTWSFIRPNQAAYGPRSRQDFKGQHAHCASSEVLKPGDWNL
jgi:hypothetical protein